MGQLALAWYDLVVGFRLDWSFVFVLVSRRGRLTIGRTKKRCWETGGSWELDRDDDKSGDFDSTSIKYGTLLIGEAHAQY